MKGRIDYIIDNLQKQLGSASSDGLLADLRHLLDHVSRRERIIGSLGPEQWKSIASRVPPSHEEERDALRNLAQLAQELQEQDEAETKD